LPIDLKKLQQTQCFARYLDTQCQHWGLARHNQQSTWHTSGWSVAGKHWLTAPMPSHMLLSKKYTAKILCAIMLQLRWLGGVVVSVSDSWSRGRGFDSRPLHCRASYSHQCASVHQAVQFGTLRGFSCQRAICGSQWHGSNEHGEYCSSGSAACHFLSL